MSPVHRIVASVTVAAGLAVAAGGALAQTAFAAQTGVSTIWPCPSFCGGPGGQFGFDNDGGEGFTNSFSSLSNIDGNGRAEATLTGQVNLPVLRAEAFASPTRSSQVQASATGMQGFYVGLDGLPAYNLTLALTGQASGTVRASVLVFRDLDPMSQPVFSTDRGSMQFEVIESSDDLQLLQAFTLNLPATGSATSASATLSFEELAVGDLFYVWASLSATGLNGTYGDAFNTLNLSYVDATGLSQLAPVPEPGTWLLMAGGLAALAWRRRIMGSGRHGRQAGPGHVVPVA